MSTLARVLLVGLVSGAAALMYFLLSDEHLEPSYRLESSKDLLSSDSGASDRAFEAQSVRPLLMVSPENEDPDVLDRRPRNLVKKWDQSLGPLEFLDHLTNENAIGPSGAADWRLSWLSACRTAQGKRLPGVQSDVDAFLAACDGILPADLEHDDPADLHAVSSTFADFAFERAVESPAGRLRDIRRNFGRSQFLKESRRILGTSIDILEIQSTIEQLYLAGELLVPEVDLLVESMPHSVISHLARDIAIIWFCDRIGGCLEWQHPLVLKRCFLANVPCYSPRDINEAIYQVTPPVMYNSLRALEASVWHFIVSGN